MTHHSVERTARGNVADISGTCGSDECPVEDVDPDDGSIEYRCPVTDEVLAEVEAVDAVEPDAERRPQTTDEISGQRRRRRR